MIIINLGLDNPLLYDGCEIEEVAGRKNLKTPVNEAVNIVGRHINDYVRTIATDAKEKVILTGPMAVWAYIVVFHAVVHVFKEVWYNDGKNVILVAKHG
jgi:hypothetical protein